MKAIRSLYLAYYLKQLDRKKFSLFLNYTCSLTGKSKSSIINDIIRSVFKFNISILEYFQFRFFELNDEERIRWAGTGYMYEYQLMMNPKDKRSILDDKREFNKFYRNYFVHKVVSLGDLSKGKNLKMMLSNASGKIVLKSSDGKCGQQVEIRNTSDFSEDGLIEYMKDKGYELVEEFVNQHSLLNQLSPSAVNTVRIITQLNEKDEVDILGCRLRISVNTPVDNMAAGNLAAVINEESGEVTGAAVYSDINKADVDYHPITNTKITGFKVPFWGEILTLAKEAALLHPQNRSIGWDIVVTEKGPGLIEGNHDWCKLLWQLPAKKGMKSVLNKYKESYLRLDAA